MTNRGAAGRAGVEVIGAARLRRTLKAAGHDLSELKAAHAAAGRIAQGGAGRLVPHRTGKLAASLRSSGTNTAAIIRAGRASVPYAGPIHWGWFRRGISPSYFISLGAQATEPVWTRVYEQAVEAAIKKVEGK